MRAGWHSNQAVLQGEKQLANRPFKPQKRPSPPPARPPPPPAPWPLQRRLQQALRCAAQRAAQRAQRGPQPELSAGLGQRCGRRPAALAHLAAGAGRWGPGLVAREGLGGVRAAGSQRCGGGSWRPVQHADDPHSAAPAHPEAACTAGCASCTVPAISRPTVTAAASMREASVAPQPHRLLRAWPAAAVAGGATSAPPCCWPWPPSGADTSASSS